MTDRDLYRILLRGFPADMRREYGAEMEELFLSALAEARGFRRVRLWGRAVSDIVLHSVGARRDATRRARNTSALLAASASEMSSHAASRRASAPCSRDASRK